MVLHFKFSFHNLDLDISNHSVCMKERFIFAPINVFVLVVDSECVPAEIHCKFQLSFSDGTTERAKYAIFEDSGRNSLVSANGYKRVLSDKITYSIELA